MPRPISRSSSRRRWTPPPNRQSPSSRQPRGGRAAATAAPAGGDPVAELEKLAQLKAQGLLSDEEFAAAKAKILGI